MIAALLTQAAAFADAASTDASDFPGKGDKQEWVKAAKIYNEGVDLFDAGRTDQAVDKFNQAISIYPYDPSFYNELGHVFNDKGGFAAAEAAHRKAIALDSSKWVHWSNLGVVLYEQDRFREAKDAFNQALKLNPAAKEKADIEETIKIIDEKIADQLNPPTLAERQRRVERNPKDIRAYVGLSWAEVLANQLKDAITTALKGLEIDPKNTSLKINLTHGYLLNGQFEKAKTIYFENKNRRNDILKDFKEMQQHGITNGGMNEIEVLLAADRNVTESPVPSPKGH